MALVITNNSPGAGEVAWSGLIIKFKDTDYPVADGNSNKKYLWWDLDNPNTMQESDTEPTLTMDDCLVILNINGTGYFIPRATMIRGEQIITGTLPTTALSGSLESHTPGMIHDYGGAITSIPSGWLLCDGSSLARVAYADLFAVIGTAFGAVDASHFNLPDLRQMFVYGADSTLTVGSEGGEATHVLTHAELPSSVPTRGDVAYSGSNVVNGYANRGFAKTNLPGGGAAHNNLPPYVALAKIIKT